MNPPAPRHILLVYRTAYPRIQGGVDTLIATLVRELLRDHRVSILAPGSWEEDQWRQEQHGPVTVYRRRLRTAWDPKRPVRGFLGWLWEFPVTFWGIWRICRQERVDLIHIFTIQRYHRYFSWIRRLGGPPYLVTFVGSDILKFAAHGSGQARILRRILAGASGLTVVAPHLDAVCQVNLPTLAPPRVIPNGVELAEFDGIHPAPSLGEVGDLPSRYLVMIGDIEPGKAPDVAIRAWGQLRRHWPDLHLVLIGITAPLPAFQPYIQGILDLIQSEGCAATVQIIWSLPRPQMIALAKNSLGVILPSRGEGLPYVLLESGAMGLATVCSRIRPFTDFLQDGEETLLVPPDDPEALANAVGRLVGDPVLAARLGRNLRQKVMNQFAAPVMADGYRAVYRDISYF